MTPPSDTEQLRIQLEQLLNGIDSQMASRLREKSGAPVESNIQRPLASGGLSSIPLPACHLPTRGQQLFDQPRPKSAQPSKPLKEPDALTQRRPSLPIQSYYPNTRLIATLDGRTASIDETSAQKRQPSQSSQTCLNEQCCSSSSVNLTTSSMKNPDTSSPVSILDASYGQNRTSNKVKLEPIITGVGTLPLSQGSIATSGPPALYSASTKSSASLRDHAVHAQNLTEKDDTLDEGLDTVRNNIVKKTHTLN
ncbi:hypothetical protein BC830DRAFT_1170422 [Chytriomyces sp. MP71]|nr:hypothetical protein BC830DRAFT_1170422 [Chytriomyces sp. MP71]